MKKFTAILLTLVLALSLAACGRRPPLPTGGTTAPPRNPQDTDRNTNAGTASVDTGRTLVCTFSATGKHPDGGRGHRRPRRRGPVPLEPADPYTDEDLNWTDESSRVVQEHGSPEARDVALVANTVDNWEAYDTVFLGYPKMEQGYICV